MDRWFGLLLWRRRSATATTTVGNTAVLGFDASVVMMMIALLVLIGHDFTCALHVYVHCLNKLTDVNSLM